MLLWLVQRLSWDVYSYLLKLYYRTYVLADLCDSVFEIHNHLAWHPVDEPHTKDSWWAQEQRHIREIKNEYQCPRDNNGKWGVRSWRYGNIK